MARVAKNGDAKALHEKLYTTLRDQICLLDHPPGKLISENALAAEFNVSRTFVRRVLNQLEFEGLLHKQNGGITVATYDIKFVREAYQLRIRLHDIVAEEADPSRVTEEQIAQLEQLLRRQQDLRSRRDLREWGRINVGFHQVYVTLISNSLLRSFMDRLYYRTFRVWFSILPDMSWDRETDYICEEIAQVTEALRKGDLQRSALIRRDHLQHFLRRLLKYLGGA